MARVEAKGEPIPQVDLEKFFVTNAQIWVCIVAQLGTLTNNQVEHLIGSYSEETPDTIAGLFRKAHQKDPIAITEEQVKAVASDELLNNIAFNYRATHSPLADAMKDLHGASGSCTLYSEIVKTKKPPPDLPLPYLPEGLSYLQSYAEVFWAVSSGPDFEMPALVHNLYKEIAHDVKRRLDPNRFRLIAATGPYSDVAVISLPLIKSA